MTDKAVILFAKVCAANAAIEGMKAEGGHTAAQFYEYETTILEAIQEFKEISEVSIIAKCCACGKNVMNNQIYEGVAGVGIRHRDCRFPNRPY